MHPNYAVHLFPVDVIVIVFIFSDFLLLINQSKVSNFWAPSHSKNLLAGRGTAAATPGGKKGAEEDTTTQTLGKLERYTG